MNDSKYHHSIKKISAHLENAKKIIIIGHHNPDGDAVGGCLGLYICLKNLGKNVNVILPNDAPNFLQWLPFYKHIIINQFNKSKCKQLVEDADMIFCIDFSSFERIEGMEGIINQSKAFKVVIDHHPNPEDHADLLISDINKSSASELVYGFIYSSFLRPYFNKDAATCIYTGMVTDTINFTVNSSNPETFEIVSKLISYEIDKDLIYNRIYNNFSFERIKFMGWILYEKLKIINDDKVAYIIVSKDDLRRFNFKNGDQEGIVNIPLSISEVQVSILAIEKDDHIKLSLRSKDQFDVNKMARNYFNGGGHKNAAGGKLFIPFDKTEDILCKVINEFLI